MKVERLMIRRSHLNLRTPSRVGCVWSVLVWVLVYVIVLFANTVSSPRRQEVTEGKPVRDLKYVVVRKSPMNVEAMGFIYAIECRLVKISPPIFKRTSSRENGPNVFVIRRFVIKSWQPELSVFGIHLLSDNGEFGFQRRCMTSVEEGQSQMKWLVGHYSSIKDTINDVECIRRNPSTFSRSCLALNPIGAILGGFGLLLDSPEFLSSVSSHSSRFSRGTLVCLSHFFELSIQDQQRANVQGCQYQSNNHTATLKQKSDSVSIIVYGTVALFGTIVFFYFFWQAHYCFKFSLGLFLSLAGLGLLIFLFGFCMVLYSLMNEFEPLANDSEFFIHSCDNVPRRSARDLRSTVSDYTFTC
jgi:hypothetical protein